VLVLTHQENQPEPGAQGYAGLVEDRSGSQGDLGSAPSALIQPPSPDPASRRGSAPVAPESFGPPAFGQVLSTRQLRGETPLNRQQIMRLVHAQPSSSSYGNILSPAELKG
jgi:hypothetical protein